MSVIARCAATPSTCELANDVAASTTVAAPAAIASFGSRSQLLLANDVVHQVLGRQGQHQPGEPVDHHEHHPER